MDLTPEEQAMVDAGTWTPPVLASEEPAEELELEELETISEEIALLAIETDEKFTEVLECLEKLERSSETENPVSQAMLTELTSLKTDLAEQRGILVSLQTSLTAMSPGIHPALPPNELREPNLPPMETESPSEQKPEESIEELAPGEERKRNRRIL